VSRGVTKKVPGMQYLEMSRVFRLGRIVPTAAMFAVVLASGCTTTVGPDDSPATESGGASGSGSGGVGNNSGAGTGAGGANGGGGTSGSATGGGGSGGDGGPVAVVPRIARLTHFQWRNAVQALLRLDSPPTQAESFPPDAFVGFDTNATHLRVSSTLRGDYETAAEAVARQVASDPNAIARLMPQNAPVEATERARAFIESFGLRAHRRPLTATEAAQYLVLFQKGPELVADLDAFAAGVMLVIQAALQSPHFLYRTELSQENVNGRLPLSNYEVAAKLALAVTGSGPDDSLLDAAASGSLAQAEIETHAARLLETPQAKATALHLHTQALAISRYSLILRESTNYPEFSAGTPAALRQSAELFLGSIYDGNLGVKALLTSPVAFVNDNLARIYGLPGTFGADFAQVDLTAQGRSGLLTQLGFLALFAGEFQPDPIHRGVFINEHVLCVEVGVPEPNIPPLPEPGPTETNRQRIDAVTGVGTCGEGCHAAVINPLGFAFENYDSLGRYRATDNNIPVNAAGVYPLDGADVSFSNALELIQLLASSETANRCYASHWLSYLHGRNVDGRDAAVLDDLAARSKVQEISAKDLIRSLVQVESFVSRPAME
jgi:hypothetical protein